MPAVNEQFVSEFLVSGYSTFKRAMMGADRLMGGLEDRGSRLGGVLTTALGTAMGNTAVRAAWAVADGFQQAGRAAKDFIGESFGLAQDFQASMAVLEIAAGESGLGLQELQDAVIAVGGDAQLLNVSASDAAEAITGLYKAGLSTGEIFGDLESYLAGTADLSGALRASIDLAAASELDMVQASDLASIALSSFGANLEDSEERAKFVNYAMNSLVKAADASVADVSDLAEALKMVAPTAGATGIGIDQVNQALAILSMRGIKGSMAGVSLNAMLNSLRDLTPKARKTLESLGIAIRDTEGNLLPLPDLIANFQEKLGDASAAERDTALGAIFTAQGLRAMDTLIKEGTTGWEEMGEAIGNAATIQDVATKRASTYAGRLEAFEGNLETLKIQIGNAFLPVATEMLGLFSKLLDEHGPQVVQIFQTMGEALSGLVQGFTEKGLIVGLENFMTALGIEPPQGLWDAINGLLELFNALKSGLAGFQEEGLFVGLENFLSALNIEPPQALWDVLNWLLEIKDPILEFISNNVNLQDVLLGLGAVIASAVIPVLISVAGFLLSIIGPVLLAIAVAAALRAAWENNFLGIRDIVMTVIGWLKEFVPAAIQTIRTWWEQHGTAILTSAQTVWNTIMSVIETVLTIIKNVVTRVVGAIQSFWDAHGQAITEIATTAWNTIQTIIETVITVISEIIQAFISAIKGDWHAFGEHLRNAVDSMWEAIKTIFKNAVANIKTVIREFIQTIKDKFRNVDWGQVGKNVINGIIKGIKNGAQAIANAAKEVAQAALDAAKGFLGIESPSKVFEGVGLNIGAGMVEGIDRSTNEAKKAIQGLLKAASGEAVLTLGVRPLGTRAREQVANLAQPQIVTNNVQVIRQYNLTTQAITRPGGLAMEFAAMEAAGAIAA